MGGSRNWEDGPATETEQWMEIRVTFPSHHRGVARLIEQIGRAHV